MQANDAKIPSGKCLWSDKKKKTKMKTENRLFARFNARLLGNKKRGNPISTLVFVKKNKKRKLCQKNKKTILHPIGHIFNFPILLSTPFFSFSHHSTNLSPDERY
jgi:hypothetical protein